jgi:hypothetical protein
MFQLLKAIIILKIKEYIQYNDIKWKNYALF